MRRLMSTIAISLLCLLPIGAPVAAGGIPIAYHLDKSGDVSVNIYDAHGQVVRELMHALTRPAGRNVDTWDGLDQSGRPAPAGDYTWKLLATPGLKAQYLMSLGNSYPNSDDDWRGRAPGTHGGPTAVAFDQTGIYCAASCTENIENYLVKMDPTGQKRLWSGFPPVPWNGAIEMASDSGVLYVLATNGDIWPYDAATGKPKTILHIPIEAELPAAMSARGGRLALAYPKHNVVAWADPATATIVDRVDLAAPVDVSITPDGNMLALTGSAVYEIPHADKSVKQLVGGLTDASRMGVDSSIGDILVAETGTTQQVKRFSATGAALATYGRAGGRQDGLYHPEDFRDVSAITGDGAGGFFVSEPTSAPRRTAHFDHDGKLIHEWYGGQAWGSWVFPEPDNPNAVWMNSSWTDMMRLTVDYASRTWRVHSTYRYAGLADGLVSGHRNAEVWEGRLHDGNLYLCRSGDDPCVIRVDRKAWRLVPCTVCDGHITHDLKTKPSLITNSMGANGAYQWVDANGDGIPQLSEIIWYPNQGPWHGLASVNSSFDYLFDASNMIQRYTVKSWNAVGAPFFGDFPAGDMLAPNPPRATSIEPRWGSYFARDDSTGDYYGAFNDRMPTWGKSLDSSLTKWDSAGKPQWTVGQIGDSPGSIWRPFRRYAGMAHGCPIFTGFSYEWPQDGPTATYVWDKDGLWVGSVFDNPDLSAADEHLYSLGAEALASTLWSNPTDGDVLLYGNWINEARVYRITGWDGWQRAAGKVTVTDALFAAGVPARFDPAPTRLPPANGAGLKGEYYANDHFDPKGLKVTRIDPSIDFSWGVFGAPDFKPIPEIGPVGFSIHWSGQIVPRISGLYAFRSGYASIGKIHIASAEFRDPGNDRIKGRYRVRLEAGRPYDIGIDYSTYMTHPSLHHGIRLEWLAPGSGTWELVPTSQMFPTTSGPIKHGGP